jgi:tetratricopeptide (TPR) repeat protein
MKAEAAFRQGKIAEAFALLQEATKKHPLLPPARVMLARLYFLVGQTAKGHATLEQAAAESFTHPEVYLTNGNQALAEGRITDTILNCQAAITLSGDDRWSAEQKTAFRREARAGLAAAFEARKDWEAARVQLSALLEIEPKSGPARQRLARALLMLGRDTEALHELQQAGKDDPNLDPPEVTMGRLWEMKGDAKRAEEWFEQSVQKYPKDARAHRAFGGWLLDRGRADAAKVHIDVAAQLEPRSRETLGLKGLLARYRHDYESAVKIFEQLARDEPGNFFAANHLALAYAELPDKHQRAVQLAEVNARQYPRLSDALATLGWAYFKAGRLDDADKVLSASASGGQISSDTAYYLARVLKDKGQPAQAKELLKKALDSDAPFVNRAPAQELMKELSKSADKK